jgi:hypothetical protein
VVQADKGFAPLCAGLEDSVIIGAIRNFQAYSIAATIAGIPIAGQALPFPTGDRPASFSRPTGPLKTFWENA